MADKYTATVVVRGSKSTETVLYELEASTPQELKHKIYLLSFDDMFGENDATLRQWKADNQIKGKK
jgi:hypothetical protein